MSDDESEALVDVIAPCVAMKLGVALDSASQFGGIEELFGGAGQDATPEMQEVFVAGINAVFG